MIGDRGKTWHLAEKSACYESRKEDSGEESRYEEDRDEEGGREESARQEEGCVQKEGRVTDWRAQSGSHMSSK